MSVTPTWIKWYNSESGSKVASADVGPYEDIPYGTTKPGEKHATGKPPHPEHGDWQWGLACSKTSRVIVIDIDHPDKWHQGSAYVELGDWEDAANSYREDGERAHVVITVPEELLPHWPKQGPTVWGDVKSNGFSYIGGVHHSGMQYTETGRPWVTADARLLTALTEDRIFPQGRGATGVMAGPWETEGYLIQTHDECVATVMSMVSAGLDEHEIYSRLEDIMPNRDGDWPERDAYIHEKISSAGRKIAEREDREQQWWSDFFSIRGTSAEEVTARRTQLANQTPVQMQHETFLFYQNFVQQGHSLKGVDLPDLLNPYHVPVEHRVVADQGIARDILEAAIPVFRYATDEDTWYVNEGLCWSTRPKDYGQVIASAWSADLKSPMQLEDELATQGTAQDDDAIKADDNRKDRLKKSWGRLNSTAGQSAIGTALRTTARTMSRFNFAVADADAEPSVLWAGGQPWNLLDPCLSVVGDADLVHLKSAAVFPEFGFTPAFDQVLAAVWPDPEVQAWALREIAGVTLWGDTSKEHPVLDGPPGAGKSTFALILHNLLGSYSVKVSPEKIFGDAIGSAAEEEVAAMIGARCVWMDEPPPRDKQAVSRFNDLASGTGTIAAARKYQNRVEAPKRFNFLICENPRNMLDMSKQGVAERITFIPCEGTPAITLAAYDNWRRNGAAERPAILARLIRECALYRTGQRYPVPTLAALGRADAQERSDEFGAWLFENFEILPDVTKTTDAGLNNSPTTGSLRSEYNSTHARDNRLPAIKADDVKAQLAKMGVKVATAGNGNARRKDVVFIRPATRLQVPRW